MILCRKLIEDNEFISESESGIFEYVWLDEITEEYEEVLVDGSKILGIDSFHHRVVNSYSFSRWEMNAILISLIGSNFAGWGTAITSDERKCVSKHLLAPYSLRVPANYTDQEDNDNSVTLLTKTITDRKNLIELMRKTVFIDKVRTGEMTLTDSRLFAKDTLFLFNCYIISADPEFKQWLTNAVGTPYETEGFEQKTYWTQELEDNLISIYNNF